MTYTNDMNAFEGMIKKAIEESMNKLMVEIELIIKRHIDVDFYGTYKPKFYKRSGDLLITPQINKAVTTGSSTTASVQLDSDQLRHSTFTNYKGEQQIRHSTMPREDLLRYIMSGSFRDIYSDSAE